MDFGRFLCLLFLVSLTFLLPATKAYKFYVGGRDGWVLKPSEGYNHWAERNRFQVNDTLYFKYNKGSDSVLVVNKDNFDRCNTSNPNVKLEDGNSEFMFDRSGPFFFISGKEGNCANGQKLIVVVLAVRNRQTPPAPSSPSPSPSPSTSPIPAPEASTTPATSPPSQVGTAPSGDTPSPPAGSNADSTTTKGNGADGVTASSVMVSSVVVLASLVFMMSSFSY